MIEFDNLTYLHGKPQGTGLLKAISLTSTVNRKAPGC